MEGVGGNFLLSSYFANKYILCLIIIESTEYLFLEKLLQEAKEQQDSVDALKKDSNDLNPHLAKLSRHSPSKLVITQRLKWSLMLKAALNTEDIRKVKTCYNTYTVEKKELFLVHRT